MSGFEIELGQVSGRTKTRYFRFTPVVAGEYTLAVESNGLFVKSTRGSADIDVFVNDRRILARVFSAF